MSILAFDSTGSSSEMEGDAQRPDNTEEQKEKRRVQNRESQRRWRQRNKSSRAKLAQHLETMASRTIPGHADSSVHSQSTLQAVPESGLGMHTSQLEGRYSLLERMVDNPESVSDFPLFLDGDSLQPRDYGMQGADSRHTRHDPSNMPHGSRNDDPIVDQRQMVASTSLMVSPATRPQRRQSYRNPAVELGLQASSRLEPSSAHIHRRASLYSLASHEAFSTSTNSPMTSASMNIQDPVIPDFGSTNLIVSPSDDYFPSSDMDQHTNMLASLGGQLSPQQIGHQGPNNFAIEVLGPNDMLDLIHRVYQSGVDSGYWMPDINVLNWLELTRRGIQNPAFFQ